MIFHYCLIVEYASGECAFPTNTDDIQEALEEFIEKQKESFNSVLGDKAFSLPTIISAKIVKMYYRNE